MQHSFLSRPLSFLGWTIAMLFWLVFQHVQSDLCKWFKMQQHIMFSMSPREPMLHLSCYTCTGYRLRLTSSSRHWCMPAEQPWAPHSPTSALSYASTSPPEAWNQQTRGSSGSHCREAQNHSPGRFLSPYPVVSVLTPSVHCKIPYNIQETTNLFCEHLTASS